MARKAQKSGPLDGSARALAALPRAPGPGRVAGIMAPPEPPVPQDGIYRAILMVLVASVLIGAAVALAGELVYQDRGIANAGAWMALICGGLYFFFRLLGRREMRRRAGRERDGADGDPEA